MLSPNLAQIQQRKDCIDSIRSQTESFFHAQQLAFSFCVIGSSVTGLSLPDSDIDIVIRPLEAAYPFTLQHMHDLAQHLRPLTTQCEVISSASVPLIKCVIQNFTVDITFNITTGISTTLLTLNFLQQNRCLRPLLLVLKQLLKSRHLGELYSGGLSSLSLTLLAVNFLNSHLRSGAPIHASQPPTQSLIELLLPWSSIHVVDQPPILSSVSDPVPFSLSPIDEDLGMLLLSFLDFYSRFPFPHLGISIQHGYYAKVCLGMSFLILGVITHVFGVCFGVLASGASHATSCLSTSFYATAIARVADRFIDRSRCKELSNARGTLILYLKAYSLPFCR